MSDRTRIEELKRRVVLDPASIAFAALAEECRRHGDYEDAIATCRAGLQRHPAYLSARVTLGRALLGMGRFDEAREELAHVLRAAPDNLAAIRALAEIHHRRDEAFDHDHTGNPEHPRHAADPSGAAAPVTADPAPASAPAAPVASAAMPAEDAARRPPIRLSQMADAPAGDVHPEAPPAAAARCTGALASDQPGETSPGRQSARHSFPRAMRSLATRKARVPHPDEAALPRLESLLAAILRARSASPAGSRRASEPSVAR